MNEYKPIETLNPKYLTSRKMFVVIAMNLPLGTAKNYTTDPYCVWYQNGEFVRWPHPFPPTHWFELPETKL